MGLGVRNSAVLFCMHDLWENTCSCNVNNSCILGNNWSPSARGPQKIQEKMCKTFARHCTWIGTEMIVYIASCIWKVTRDSASAILLSVECRCLIAIQFAVCNRRLVSQEWSAHVKGNAGNGTIDNYVFNTLNGDLIAQGEPLQKGSPGRASYKIKAENKKFFMLYFSSMT